jgi:hypothetical protein
MRNALLASTIALLGLTGTAQAHFVLQSPAPTNPADLVPQTLAAKVGSNEASGKGGFPCGPDAMMAATPTAAQGGHTVSLKIEEVVRHGGFYRVAMSINSRSEIPPNNVVYDSSGKVLPPDGKPTGTSDHADWEMVPTFPVLADHLFDHPMSGPGDQTYMMDIKLPNVNCDRCTLQVIEFMAPHGYNGTPGQNNGGGYFYQHCAELKITADPALPLFVPPGSDGGAPDAASSDAKQDASGSAGQTGSGGSAGSGAGGTGAAGTGVTGAGGMTGAGGSSMTGVAGSGAAGSASGAAGSATGTAGSNTGAAGAASGAAGSSTGSAGATGAAGTTSHSSSGGGCTLADGAATSMAPLAFILVAVRSARRRSRRRSHS